jgi:hypothetical protein
MNHVFYAYARPLWKYANDQWLPEAGRTFAVRDHPARDVTTEHIQQNVRFFRLRLWW